MKKMAAMLFIVQKGDDAMSLAVENGHCGVVAQLSEYMMTYNKRVSNKEI